MKFWIFAALVALGVWTYRNYDRAYTLTYQPCLEQGGTDEDCSCIAGEWQAGFALYEYIPYVSNYSGAHDTARRDALYSSAEAMCLGG